MILALVHDAAAQILCQSSVGISFENIPQKNSELAA